MKPDLTLIFPKSDFLINQTVFLPLGILYISSHFKRNDKKVQCLDFGIGHTVDMVEAEIVGVSITTPQREDAFNIVKELKQLDKYTIAGGPHATHMEKECYSAGYDLVIKGEAEYEFFDAPSNVDDIGFPDRDALPIKKYKYYIDNILATTLITSRGCPFNCSFCARISKSCKIQSPERTVREIIDVYLKYGFKAFMIFDDVFTISKKRVRKITELLDKEDFIFRCFSRANMLDKEMCELLKELNVKEVGIGIESGSQKVLDKNMKGTTIENNTIAVKNLQDVDIRAKVFLIVGLPGEDEQSIVDTERWILETKPNDIDISIFQPLPGSDIFGNPKKYGIKFNYNSKNQWYKGTPGKYISNVRTEKLTEDDIVFHRDRLESLYKNRKLLR